MAIRQYIGARYVPKLVGEWQADTFYEALSIVTSNNVSYTSKKPVPHTVGAPAQNPEYWVATGNYSAQMAQIIEDMNVLSGEVNTLNNTTIPAINASVSDVSSHVTRTYPTVVTLIDDTTITEGDIVQTLEYATGKGGGAIYLITDTSDSYSISLDNGLYGHIMNDIVTPSMFGAVCDGTDDYAAFSLACGFSATKKRTLLIDKDIAIDGTIELSNFLTIKGISKGIKIKQLGTHNMFVSPEANLWYITIRDLTLDGNNQTGEAIHLEGPSGTNVGVDTCLFDNLFIENFNGHGINVRNNVLTAHFSNIIVTNCLIGVNIAGHDGFYDNIQVYGCSSNFGGVSVGGTANRISNVKCYFITNSSGAASGIVITGSNNALTNIEAQDITGSGIKVLGTANIISGALISKISKHSGGDHTGIKIEGDANTVSASILATDDTMTAVVATGGYNNIVASVSGTFTAQYTGATTNYHLINGATA